MQVIAATVKVLPIVFLSEFGDGTNGACGGEFLWHPV